MSRFKEHPTEPFVGSGNLHQEDAELRALKKRIKDLEEENEFLKKASAFFAKNLKWSVIFTRNTTVPNTGSQRWRNGLQKNTVSSAVFEYIWIFYNRKRIHEANGYLTPEDYYRRHQTDLKAA